MNKRHRDRHVQEDLEHTAVHYVDSGGTPSDFIYGSAPFVRLNERMEDTVGYWQNEYNPCYHEKFINLAKPLDSFSVEVSPGIYEHYTFSGGGVQVQDLLGVLSDLDFGIGTWLDDFSAESEDYFKTAVQDDASIINFIIEMIELCEGNVKIVAKTSKKLETGLDIFFRMLRKGSNYWVAWNFAIKPTIRDIHSMVTALETAAKRLKFLRQWNHRPIKLHYRNPGREFNNTLVGLQPSWLHHVPGGTPAVIPIPSAITCELEYTCTITLTSWAEVRFDIPDYLLDDWQLGIGMIMLTQQGVYNPLKIVWEAIPFSWLIDWFTTKRVQLLKELANLAPFPPAQILGIGHTVHVKDMFCESFLKVTGPSGNQRIAIGTTYFDRYDRRPGLPSGNPLERPPVPDVRQLSILAAIGYGNRRRR